MKYRRWAYLVITFLVILTGLASRRYGELLPAFIAKYAGDTLWAVMVWRITFSFSFRICIYSCYEFLTLCLWN